MVYANPSAFYLGGGLPACHRYSNQVASVFAHQLHGVRLERFCPWQCVFFLYLHPLVPDGTEKDRVEIYRLLCGDRGYTAALYLPPPSHRNYFVDLHIVYSGDDTRGTLCLNLYRYNESQRIDCGYQAFRIIQEMRDATDNLDPASAVWENVMGAFSTNEDVYKRQGLLNSCTTWIS